jgi:nitroreductase
MTDPSDPDPQFPDPARGASPFRAAERAPTLVGAMLSRRSVRAFRPDPVPRRTIESILALASRAPSGSNIQPWKVYAVSGAPLQALVQAMLALAEGGQADDLQPAYQYYPRQWREPYLGRRRKVGWDLYGLVGIAKGDRARTAAQHARNYRFFDAPVGLIFTVDRDMEQGAWLDYGMFLQNVMLAARAYGLDTCPQAAIAYVYPAVHQVLGIPETETLVCGIALGVACAEAPENGLVTAREPVAGFSQFIGFAP